MSEVIIPASVISIGSKAFGTSTMNADDKYLEKIVIKRTEEDALANATFEDSWYGQIVPIITYDPNYTE